MIILFWIYKSRINNSGQCPIMMRITASGKRISFTTNQFIEPKLWDKDRQRIKGTTPLVKQINDLLLTLRTSALNHYNDFIKKAIPVTPQAIRDLIFQKNKPAHTLLEAFTFHIQNLKTRVGFDTAINTVKKLILFKSRNYYAVWAFFPLEFGGGMSSKINKPENFLFPSILSEN
ncbi:MAG TPA: Arm DNA-binding domain-containing protein [Chitinophagaceae bacterium]|nr:Arm DNA-binding domain-containing protein [Chitinophagaceae bacterium]